VDIDVLHNPTSVNSTRKCYTKHIMINYIIAGNADEYANYIRGKNPLEYRYVHTPDLLLGTMNVTGKFIGSYRDRVDLKLILNRLMSANRSIPENTPLYNLIIEVFGDPLKCGLE
jgi:hypothetical protein